MDRRVFSKRNRARDVPQSAPKLPRKGTVEAVPANTDAPGGKETKSAAELAQMIEADLAKHRECPKKDSR